jgi:hypothetical protein
MYRLVVGKLEMFFTDVPALTKYIEQKSFEFDAENQITLYMSGVLMNHQTGRKEWLVVEPDEPNDDNDTGDYNSRG